MFHFWRENIPIDCADHHLRRNLASVGWKHFQWTTAGETAVRGNMSRSVLVEKTPHPWFQQITRWHLSGRVSELISMPSIASKAHHFDKTEALLFFVLGLGGKVLMMIT
jgi:hypothetical protein